jgi:hypothetical protein
MSYLRNSDKKKPNPDIMKRGLIFTLTIPLIAITVTCSTLKRYKSVDTPGVNNSLAGIDLFGYRLSGATPENAGKTLWDLSADAQSQYIKILNSRYPDNDRFIEAMSFEYLNEEARPVSEDFVSKDLRLIFSVSKIHDYRKDLIASQPDLSSADRIEYLKITLNLPESAPVRFTGWNMYTTEYGSVDIADISFSRTLELAASGTLLSDKNKSGGEISTGGKSLVSSKEEQSLKYRYLKLNGRLNYNEIEMEEEGIREVDLTGNVIADVSVRFEKYPEILTAITGMKDSSGKYNDPGKFGIKYYDVNVPGMERLKDTIYANLKMDYLFRNVLKGRRTFPEWDDRIKYYSGTVTKTIPLFTSDDYVPDFYCIGTALPGNRDVLKLSAPSGKVYSMIFRTRPEATAFQEWLIDYFKNVPDNGKPLRIGEQTLKFRDGDLTGKLFAAHSGFMVLPWYR